MDNRPNNRDVECCVYCPSLCQSRCPVSRATGDLTLSPFGKQSASWRLAKGMVKSTPETVRPLYMCFDCLACRELCDHNIDVPTNLSAARIREGERTSRPLLSERAPDSGESWRRLRDAAPSWRLEDECQALLVPGRELLEPEAYTLLQQVFRTLDRLGDMVIGITPDSVLSCGHHEAATGHLKQSRTAANIARKRFARYKQVIFVSPHCASFIRLHWPSFGLELERQFTTYTEFISQRMDYSRSGFFAKSVAYHDPCHLGRHLGQYQGPRDILKWATGEPPEELLFNRNQSWCCGGGYPVAEVEPRIADAVTDDLVEMMADLKSEVIVTGCARCALRMQAAAPDRDIRHLADIVAELKP
jgi:Fe-S oxidoreductase